MDEVMAKAFTELRMRVERLEGIVARVGPQQETADPRPHLERVIEVFGANTGEWMSATEVAEKAGIDPGAARLVLYSRRDLFTCVKVSPGRVRWQFVNPQKALEELNSERPLAQAQC